MGWNKYARTVGGIKGAREEEDEEKTGKGEGWTNPVNFIDVSVEGVGGLFERGVGVCRKGASRPTGKGPTSRLDPTSKGEVRSIK